MVNILICIFLISLNVFADNITSSTYWLNSTNSSALGMAVTGQSNHPNAVFYNPAALTSQKNNSINFDYTSYFDNDISNLSIIGSGEYLSVGFGTHILQSKDIEKTSFNSTTNEIVEEGYYDYTYYSIYLSGALKLPVIPFSSLGASYNLHNLKIDDDSLKGQSVNFGLFLSPFKFLNIGFTNFYTLPLTMSWSLNNKIENQTNYTNHTIESYSVAGIELKLPKLYNWQMTILADNQMGGTNDDASNRFGIKLNHDVIDLLGGYNDRYLSGGVSIKIENVKLNYAILMPNTNDVLENRHSFGINFRF
ncbi:MAG: hypothetical protein VXX85_03055 [Candidatus Margulisiibacteriota bacterium]|nr:hypothetical protein [Candidatus Margulisiibacteriota bacterium]